MTQPLFVFKNTIPLEEARELFCEKSSEGVLKPIVEQKSCERRELLRLQKQGKQLSLLDKREYPKGEGV